jgi:hypothetical protein
VVGDATYGGVENIRAYLATRSYEGRTPFYNAARFQYDPDRDEHRCPQGQLLRLERVKWTEDVKVYKDMGKRQIWVEPLFGAAKDWHGLRRFRLRGLWKVNCEGVPVAAGQNLKRWLSKTSWGRRHGPCGSLALVRSALAAATASAWP